MALDGILIVVVTCGAMSLTGQERSVDAKEKKQDCEIVLIGSVKDKHLEFQTYSPEILRDLVIACGPSAILIDMAPEGKDRSAPVDLDMVRRTPSLPPEVHACAEAARSLNVNLLCIDIADRQKRFEETKYFERLDRAHESTRKWMDWLTEQRSPSKVDLGIAKMTAHLVKSCSLYASPQTVNFAGLDAIMRDKYFLCFEILPAILDSYEDYASVADEWRFLGDEWTNRNRAIAARIAEIARDYRGRRLAVVVGADRRYMLRDLLEKESGIALKEYWEVQTSTPSDEGTAGQRSGVRSEKEKESPTAGEKTMHTQTSERDISLPAQDKAGREFVLSNVNGSVKVTGASAGNYGVKAILKVEAETEERVQQLIEQTGIESGENAGIFSVKVFPAAVTSGERLAVDFQVALPPQTNIQVETRNGHITVSGMAGKQECRSSNGSVSSDSASSQRVLMTQNGSVIVKCSADTEPRCRIEARAQNGSIELEGAAGLSATIKATTGNGGIRCQSPVTIDYSSGSELQGRIGAGEGRILLETLNGGVTIR